MYILWVNGDGWDAPSFFTSGLMLVPNLCVPRKGVSFPRYAFFVDHIRWLFTDYTYLSYAQFCFVYILITYEGKDQAFSENIVDGIKNSITSNFEDPNEKYVN